MDDFWKNEYFGPIKHESDAIEQTNQSNHAKRSSVNVDDSYLPAHRYYFHDDLRIQELVRSRLPNFSPLGNPLNRDLDQPGASNIDYRRQFSYGESTKQSATNTNDKQSSSGRKSSRKLKAEETSQGWVNPKLCVNKATTKRGAKRKGHAARQTPGRWLTGSDGKKVYVGRTGQELSGRVAYMRYKQESGGEFKKGRGNLLLRRRNE
nr:uncharacterized protein LOC122593142 isoform X2 [Erigeron canadensis]